MLIFTVLLLQRDYAQTSAAKMSSNFFVFAERQLEPKQVSRASGCPQIGGTLQWIQYKDHCYAFDMAFYNFSVYNVEDAKKVCQKLSMFSLFITLQLLTSPLFEKKKNKPPPKKPTLAIFQLLYCFSLGKVIASFISEHLIKVLDKTLQCADCLAHGYLQVKCR